RRPITKTKTPYENENPSRKRRHITKTSSKEVGTTFAEKDYVHETHYENEDPSFYVTCRHPPVKSFRLTSTPTRFDNGHVLQFSNLFTKVHEQSITVHVSYGR
ncbi:unnamed protein product, partial [Pocillopora meandrina]